MKNRWQSLLGVILALASSSSAQQTPGPGLVQVEVHVSKVTAKQLEDLFRESFGNRSLDPLPTPIPSAPAFMGIVGVLNSEQTSQAIKKLKEKGVSITNKPRAAAIRGEKALVQNVRGVRYPSKYSEPDAAGKMVPAEFDTKPVGFTMEITPTIGPDGSTIDLTLSLRLADLIRFGKKTSTTGRPANPEPDEQQPQFKTCNVTTEVTVYSGSTVVLAAPPENASTPADLIFVTARKLTAPDPLPVRNTGQMPFLDHPTGGRRIGVNSDTPLEKKPQSPQ